MENSQPWLTYLGSVPVTLMCTSPAMMPQTEDYILWNVQYQKVSGNMYATGGGYWTTLSTRSVI